MCFLFFDPQDEVGPSISSSVVLCSFVLLVYIVVLVLVVCLCPSLNRLKVKAILFAVSKGTGERVSESNLNNPQKNGCRFCTYSATLKTT